MIRRLIFVVVNLSQISNELKYIKIEFNLKLKYLNKKNPKTQRNSKIFSDFKNSKDSPSFKRPLNLTKSIYFTLREINSITK